MLYKIIIFSIPLFLFSCKPTSKKAPITTQVRCKRIIIQPLGNVPGTIDLLAIKNNLHKHFPIVEINKSLPLPGQAYYIARNRYRADSLIKFLRAYIPDKTSTIIGITEKDISINKNKIKDWGIMGLAYNPGSACVISSYRINKKKISEQLYKLAVHELGHTAGLSHCQITTCFMRSANGKNHLDELNSFCNECESFLKKSGWLFDK